MRKSQARNWTDKAYALTVTATTTVVILVWAAIAAAAIIFQGSTPTRAAIAAPRTHVVDIRQFKFLPKALAVQRGDVIVWVNKDIVPHTATAKDGSWDTGKIDAGGRSRMVVTGDLFRRYLCTYHGSMTGRLETKAGK